MYSKFGLYWNGSWKKSSSRKDISVISPVTEKILGKVPSANINDTKDIIESAVSGFEEWKLFSGRERSKILRKVSALILKRKNE